MSLGSNTTFTSVGLWTEALTLPTKIGKVGKIKKSDQIKYPPFMLGAELVSDEYWKEILVKAAKGKFPRGFSYQPGYLQHRASGMTIQVPDDPSSLVEAVVYFLRQKGNIYSPNDLAILESAAQQHLIDGEDAEIAWSKIYKGKNSRAKYIRDYVERAYGSLDLKIRDELFTQINTYLELDLIKKNDIEFSQGQIQMIHGLTATPGGVFPTRPMTLKTKSRSKVTEEKKPEEQRHYENWLGWMEKYSKYVYDVKTKTMTAPSFTGTGEIDS